MPEITATIRDLTVVKQLMQGFAALLSENQPLFYVSDAQASEGLQGGALLGRAASQGRALRALHTATKNRLYGSKKKFGEILEWLYLDCWLLADGVN